MYRKIILNKWFIAGAAVLLVYTLVGFLLVPPAIKYGLQKLVAKELRTPIVVDKVRTNPFTFTMDIDRFSMRDPEGGPLLEFDALFIDFDTKSLFSWAWTFKQFRLTNPSAHVTMLPGYRLNILDLIPASTSAPSETSEQLPRFTFENINLENGRLIFADQSDATPFEIQLGPTDIEIGSLTSIKDQNGEYTIAAQTDDGALINWEGRISLNPIASRGKLTVQNLVLAKPYLFVADFLNLDEPAGNINLQSEYRFAYAGGAIELMVDNTNIEVSDISVALADRQNPLLTLASSSIQNLRFDLANQLIRIGQIKAADGRLDATSDEQGIHDLEKLIRSLPETTPAQSGGRAASDVSPWRIELESVVVENILMNETDYRYIEPTDVQLKATDLGLQALVEIGADTQVELKNMNGQFNSLSVRIGDEPEPWAYLESLAYQNGTFDLKNKIISMDEIRMKAGAGQIWLDPDKKINWIQAYRLRDKDAVDKTIEAVKEVFTDDVDWSVKVQTIALSDFGANFTDKSVTPPADFNFQNTTVTLTNASNDLQKPIDFDIKVDVEEDGQLQATGSVIPGKAAVDAQVRAAGVDLKAAQPYLSAFLPLTIDSGRADLQGRLNTVTAEQQINIVYDGKVNVSRLLVNETGNGQPFVGFSAMDIPAMKLSLAPDSLYIKSVNIKAPTGRVVINEDLSINVVDIFTPPLNSAEAGSSQPQKEEPAREFPIVVQRIRIDDGQLDLDDLSVTPKFNARLRELGGVINGLSATKDSRASIKMDGRINEHGQLKMSGQLKPMQPTDFLDMNVIVANLKMNSLTPYTMKYTGREIKAGSLSLDLKYLLKQQELVGDNGIVADKMVLGPKTEAEGEYDLPLDLAVALLKDPKDRINLSLKVEGRLDDPEFNFGQLVGQSFGKVLGNIASAPFAAIGRMVGAKDTRLDAIGFDPGQTQPSPPEMEKMLLVAQGLQERPDLMLRIQGQFNRDVDGRYLRSLAVRREIARRLKIDIGADEDPGQFDTRDKNVQQVIETMTAERYSPEVLDQLKKDFEKDSGAVTASTSGQSGQDPGQLHRSMFEYLVEQQPLEAPDMSRLARGRSDVVYQTLTKDGQIDPDRLIVLDPVGTNELLEGKVQAKLSIDVKKK